MKKLKKLFAVMLSLIMVLAMGITSFADTNSAKLQLIILMQQQHYIMYRLYSQIHQQKLAGSLQIMQQHLSRKLQRLQV